MTLRFKSSTLQGTCICLQFHYSSMFGACYLMKLNVIITCFVFSFSMCYLAISFFLNFYITLTISCHRKKNHSDVMTNFIFCLSTSRHRLNQVDLQELWHCDCTRPLKNSPHCHSRRFSLRTEFIHISMIVVITSSLYLSACFAIILG